MAVFDQEDFKESFDVVITIEMFEHMKNYQKLLEKVASWMKKPGELLFYATGNSFLFNGIIFTNFLKAENSLSIS